MTRRYLVVLLLFPLVLAFAGRAFSGSDSTAAGPKQDGTLPALSAIAGRGLMDSQAFEYLTELSDDIGGRVTGTPAADAAVSWGVQTMKAIGLSNVHSEPWDLWQGWQRVS